MKQFYRSLMLAALLALPSLSVAQVSMDVERVVSGLSSPVFVTHAPGDADRLFIVQRGGQIRIFNTATGSLNSSNFMTVPGVTSGGEQGLLGLAFHPDYQTNGFFYVYFTDNSGGDSRIQRFTRTNADSANSNTVSNVLIEINQPFANHNGGWIGFGPDGFLHIGTGDGGSGNDPQNNSQDITNNLLGKMLRIDVDGDDFPGDNNRNYSIPASNPFVGVTGDDEIFLYGLRNPWRCSFDRLTGDLWIADVGQNAREEINVYLNGSNADKNYGWRLREGTIQTPGVGGARPSDNVDPVYDYAHNGGAFGGFSTTGGYVYRGPIADLEGLYFFSDFVSERIWSFRYDGTTTFNGSNFTGLRDWTNIINTDVGSIADISSFGEDLDGNLYIVDLGGGEIFKITDASLSVVVDVSGLNALRGLPNSGSVGNLSDSDDQFITFNPGFTLNSEEPPIWLEMTGNAGSSSPGALSFTLEARANSFNILQEIKLLNYDTGEFELMDTQNASFNADSVVTVSATGDVSRFVDAGNNNQVRAQTAWRANGFLLVFPWLVSVDQAEWSIVE